MAGMIRRFGMSDVRLTRRRSFRRLVLTVAARHEPGSPMQFVFHFKNGGTAPLQISKVKPSCGCLVADYDREIAPGGAGTISATFDTEG